MSKDSIFYSEDTRVFVKQVMLLAIKSTISVRTSGVTVQSLKSWF